MHRNIFFLYLVFGLWGSLWARQFSFGENQEPFKIYKAYGVSLQSSQRLGNKIVLSRQGFNADSLPMEKVYIDFSKPIDRFLSGIEVLTSRYRFIEGSNILGKAAGFERQDHEITFKSPSFLFTERKDHVGDFSFYLRLKPYERKNQMDILRKGGVFEGKLVAIKAFLSDGILVFSFRNFFSLNNQFVERLEIASKYSLSLVDFSNVVLNYKEASGQLTLFVNGIEQDRIYVTDNGKMSGTPLLGKFHRFDGSVFQLGKGFLGQIDEMALCNCNLEAQTSAGSFSRRIKNSDHIKVTKGTYISPRYDIGFSASVIEKISLEKKMPAGTRIRFYLRHRNSYFSESMSESQFPFQEWNGKKKVARYFQFKADLFPNALGNKTPELKRVSIRTIPNPPPNAPRGLSVVEEGQGSITLSFLRNPEIDVVKGGRYHIYYGLEKDKALGVIRYAQVESIGANDFRLVVINDKNFRQPSKHPKDANRLVVKVTNKMITENLFYTQKKPRLKMSYPLLQRDVPFYFWVTACDSAYKEMDIYHDHESGASNKVVGRPN